FCSSSARRRSSSLRARSSSRGRSPGFGAYSSAMTAPVSRPIKKPMAGAPPFGRRETPTLALRAPFREPESDGSQRGAQRREKHLRVTEHAEPRSGQLAGGLGDRDGGERENPRAAERARLTERRAERRGDTDRDERKRDERRRHSRVGGLGRALAARDRAQLRRQREERERAAILRVLRD